MLFNIKPNEKKIFEIISECGEALGMQVYAIGGYVRDRILARESKDMDIVCLGDGVQLAEEVAGRMKPVPRVTIYSRFGTALIKHKDLEIEFVGARKESYRHDSRKPDVSSGSLEDDQNRRDFTINAISVSLNKADFGALIDPFNGMEDLAKKIIKTPTDPDQTFSDDPLRMMRAIRFATQLGFTIEETTYQSIAANKHRIKIVSMERIRTELEKIIMTPKPSEGFDMLFKTGILEIIFPELVALYGVEYQNGRGHKDNFYHTLLVLDNVCKHTNNIWLRWAAIFHDIAKPQTKRYDPENGWSFHGHEALGAAILPRIFKHLRLPLDNQMKYVQKLVRLHLRPIALTQEIVTESALRRLLFEAGEDLEDLLTLCEADITSKNPDKVHRYLENYKIVRERLYEVEEQDKIRNWQPPITGEMIMEIFNLKPGREVGILKTAVREAILDGEIPNDYDAAYAFLLDQGKKMGLSQSM